MGWDAYDPGHVLFKILPFKISPSLSVCFSHSSYPKDFTRGRALRTGEWRLREDKSPSVGPRMPCTLLHGGVAWRKMSSKSQTASEMEPSTPLIQQSNTVSLGDAGNQTYSDMSLFTECVRCWLQSWAACMCLIQIYRCPQVCDLSDDLIG